MKTDEDYIKHCSTLAAQAGITGNSPVGALIIKDGEIIAEAGEATKSKNDITCHAELEAVKLAAKNLHTNDLSDCILYTTHEPCVMCSYAIRFYKIKKVVYENKTLFLGGIHSAVAVLTSADVPPHWSQPPEVVQFNSPIILESPKRS